MNSMEKDCYIPMKIRYNVDTMDNASGDHDCRCGHPWIYIASVLGEMGLNAKPEKILVVHMITGTSVPHGTIRFVSRVSSDVVAIKDT